jgi:hypothetical protein
MQGSNHNHVKSEILLAESYESQISLGLPPPCEKEIDPPDERDEVLLDYGA